MELQSYLSKPYQGHESFLEHVIFPIFGEDNYETSYDVELLDSEDLRGLAGRTGIHSIIRCGTIDLDLTPIEVFDITVSNRLLMDKNRVGVQAVIRRVMDTYSGAFMIIHYDNDVKWDWRFSFCQLKDKGEFSDNKRYTFLLGPNQSCRTAAQNFQRLADLHENITIKDIVSAFDVEALSNAFFDGYKRHYERFVEFITGKRFIKEGGKFVEKISHDPHPEYYPAFDNNDKSVRDYTKLLLARIVFLHFLQKKGWLGVPLGGKWGDGDEQFMKHLFEKASVEQKDDYLESVLEPLFFDALNGDRTAQKDVFDTNVVGKVRIPYLNGGLFSRDSLDDIVIRYPKEFFGDFLEFLYQYNFTIDENDPNEAQVGIDPEMLGKIFENLLEDNKDKGAFYTPKEIVQYMCRESLVASLVTKTGYDEERLRAFVKNPFAHVSEFSPDEQYAILGAILNIKICDPAIGSGAFPIGLLNELVRCKEAIYGDEKGRAEIKKEIIRDNIYGVDIEKGAVDIARLRFWLSLIVDEEAPLPLPNLDYKIMQGNSLLEWHDGVDLSHLVDAGETNLFLSGAGDLKKELAESLRLYFDEANHLKKKSLKEHISGTIKKILDIAGVDIPQGIDVSENTLFFLWHTWFNEVFVNGGFDIVIGNPPYVDVKGMPPKEVRDYFRLYSTAEKRINLYALFIEFGYSLLNSHGVLCYINPNSLLVNESYCKLRKRIIDEVTQIIKLPDAIFKQAVVETMIFQLVRGQSDDLVECCYFKNNDKTTLDNVSFSRLSRSEWKADGSARFNIFTSSQVNRILRKIEVDAHPLADYIDSSLGITPYDKAKGHTKEMIKERAFHATQQLSDEYVPLIEGRNIHPYYISAEVREYLKYGPWLGAPREKRFFTDPRVIVRQIVGGRNLEIIAAYADSEYYFTQIGFALIPKSRLPEDAKYLAALLNSKVMSFYHKYTFLDPEKVVFQKVLIANVKQLPIRKSTNKEEIVKLVDIIRERLSKDPTASITDLQNRIDLLIFNDYNLSTAEAECLNS